MNKKIFTLALLAVFLLAQFGMTSAAPTDGVTVTFTPGSIPTFLKSGQPYPIEFSLSGLPGDPIQNILLYVKVNSPSWGTCLDLPTNINNLTSASAVPGTIVSVAPDQTVIDLYVLIVDTDDTVDDNPANGVDDDCDAHAAFMNTKPEEPQVSSIMDVYAPWTIDYQAPNPAGWGDDVACNTFEMYALTSDSVTVAPGLGYSGFDSWNAETTGTFAPPAPEGPDGAELSWIVTLPSTASEDWSFRLEPTDVAGNYTKVAFWSNEPIVPSELEECANFSDVAGHANEVYIRYLADLGLIAGFADGTFGPDNTLTRAEAATLFEKANGRAEDDVDFPASAPAGCEFTDVAASDWFSGWVWAACEDGFMSGIGGGLFDPNNLLTRGQVVTIFNNIHEMSGGTGGYLNFGAGTTTLENGFGNFTDEFRSSAWTDLYIGDYYTLPAIYAYGVGIADGTSATTFSPNQAATRGEFAKMLYRALGEYDL